MSVRTEADDQLDRTREHVLGAIMALNKILIEECWGHDEYNEAFRNDIQDANIKLLEVRKLLRR
jgi:hypothetical protein